MAQAFLSNWTPEAEPAADDATHPQGTATMAALDVGDERRCQNCGTLWDQGYRRAVGDENDIVWACDECEDQGKVHYNGYGAGVHLR